MFLPKWLAECRESFGNWMGNVSLGMPVGKSAALSEHMCRVQFTQCGISLLCKWILQSSAHFALKSQTPKVLFGVLCLWLHAVSLCEPTEFKHISRWRNEHLTGASSNCEWTGPVANDLLDVQLSFAKLEHTANGCVHWCLLESSNIEGENPGFAVRLLHVKHVLQSRIPWGWNAKLVVEFI